VGVFIFFLPLLAFKVLAMRTMSITAGMGDAPAVIAFGALGRHARAVASAAEFHARQDLAMRRQ